MLDEKFVFFQDIKEKKQTGRSAYNRKTHAGKGGAVKLPSDYLSKKEREAMNGEVKTYRMNDPMDFAEFVALPDDLKVAYIKALRERFDVPDVEIGKMMNVGKDRIFRLFKKLGLCAAKMRGRRPWDEDGWYRWVGTANTPAESATMGEQEPLVEENTLGQTEAVNACAPCSGSVTFIGAAGSALKTVMQLLGAEQLKITVSWEAVSDA